MTVTIERSIYETGTLIRVNATEISVDARAYHGQIGLISKVPIRPGVLYEVMIDNQFIWLMQSEMDIVKERYRILS